MAEATWSSGVFVKPWDYNIVGSAVGYSPWSDFEGIIVETPESQVLLTYRLLKGDERNW